MFSFWCLEKYWDKCVCVCVCSNSRNDVPRVAQRYGTIAAHTRRRASVLVVFVVFSVHMYSFAGLIRRTPPPTFSDTAITDRHSDTTIFQLTAHWVQISWSIGSINRSDMCPRWKSNPRLPACKASTLSTRPGSPLSTEISCCSVPILLTTFPPEPQRNVSIAAVRGAVRPSSTEIRYLILPFIVHLGPWVISMRLLATNRDNPSTDPWDLCNRLWHLWYSLYKVYTNKIIDHIIRYRPTLQYGSFVHKLRCYTYHV